MIPKEIAILQQILKRERFKKLLVVLIAFLGGGTFFLLTIFLNPLIHSFLFLMGFLVYFVGGLFLVHVIRTWNICYTPVYCLFTNDIENLVWVYQIKLEMMPFGIKFWNEETLVLKTLDAKEHQIRAFAPQIKLLTAYLAKQAPHISFGYTAEKEQWYTASPMLLLEDRAN
ncbi:MAG: hypothetical protein MK212_08570 [Saprospiraceae bacterium]|nr:hypothetical protein [Saprospiraceae bacterium]